MAINKVDTTGLSVPGNVKILQPKTILEPTKPKTLISKAKSADELFFEVD